MVLHGDPEGKRSLRVTHIGQLWLARHSQNVNQVSRYIIFADHVEPMNRKVA